MKNLKEGQMANATHHRCRQSQCAFWKQGGCQACDDCGADPYEMSNACDRCYACENIPDALRWGKRNDGAMLEAKQRNKEKLVILP